MTYPPCPPWAGWYGSWAPLPMPFHPGWSGPAESFGYGGFYVGGSRYRHIGHQQDRGAPRLENRIVRNAKLDHLISQGATTAPGHRHEQESLKEGPSADQPEGSQGRTGPRSESLANGKAKPNAEKSPEEVATEQNKVPKVKTKTRTGARTSSWRSPKRTVQFPKPDHPISSASGQKKPSSTTAPGMAPAPCWCPPGLTPSQRRRIQ
jgi:hypothetical protein